MIRKLCPGITLSAVSSSGAPRKIEGIKSINVWVIAIEAIRIISPMGEKKFKRKTERDTIKIAIRFVCIPGIRPVNVPAIIPINRAKTASNIIILNRFIKLG